MMEVNWRVLIGKHLKVIQESDQSLLTLLIAVKIWLNLTSTLLKTKFSAVLKVRGRLKFQQQEKIITNTPTTMKITRTLNNPIEKTQARATRRQTKRNFRRLMIVWNLKPLKMRAKMTVLSLKMLTSQKITYQCSRKAW